ncbi:MAG: hypothetical protein ABUL73_00655 [Alphaproteobacteria bacterium]
MITAAALLLPLALLMQPDPSAASSGGAAPPSAMPHLTGSGDARFHACVNLIDLSAERAYEEGMAWAAETHEVGGYRCAAMALAAEPGRAAEAARRLESLATTVAPDATGLRTELFSQAGNAWLLAYDAAHARSDFTQGIAIMQADRSQLPDLYIDRSRAYALEKDYRHAEEDLSQALDIRPQDALALRLRASARMHQNAFDLAEADAQAAVNLDPTNVDALVTLGNAHEARRTGHPVEDQ